MSLNEITVTTEEDAPPIVRVFANTFRLNFLQPANREILKQLQGCFALRSVKGGQSVTITIKDRHIHLVHGVSPESKIVLTLDFDKPDTKPRIKGLWKHPLYAMRVGKLLTLPLPNWTDSAKRFWQVSKDVPFMPVALKITCTGDNRSLALGEGERFVELFGNSAALEKLFAGNSLLVQELFTGAIKVRAEFGEIAALSQAGQRIMLGEVNAIGQGGSDG